MRHSAFVCPAASINYDLLKWISLGALESWPKRLDGHMCLSEQVHHSRDSRSADNAGDPASSQAGTVGGKTKERDQRTVASVQFRLSLVVLGQRDAETSRAPAHVPPPARRPRPRCPLLPSGPAPRPAYCDRPGGSGVRGFGPRRSSGRPPDSRSPLTLRLLPSR